MHTLRAKHARFESERGGRNKNSRAGVGRLGRQAGSVCLKGGHGAAAVSCRGVFRSTPATRAAATPHSAETEPLLCQPLIVWKVLTTITFLLNARRVAYQHQSGNLGTRGCKISVYGHCKVCRQVPIVPDLL